MFATRPVYSCPEHSLRTLWHTTCESHTIQSPSSLRFFLIAQTRGQWTDDFHYCNKIVTARPPVGTDVGTSQTGSGGCRLSADKIEVLHSIVVNKSARKCLPNPPSRTDETTMSEFRYCRHTLESEVVTTDLCNALPPHNTQL